MNSQLKPVENLKKTYTPPVLVNFGEVRELTQGGRSGVPEGLNSSSGNKKN